MRTREPFAMRDRDCLCSAMNAELGQDALDVRCDSFGAENEFRSYRLLRSAVREQHRSGSQPNRAGYVVNTPTRRRTSHTTAMTATTTHSICVVVASAGPRLRTALLFLRRRF